MLALALLIGCGCGSDPPSWSALEPVYLGGEAVTVDLNAFVTDDKGVEEFTVDFPEGLIADIVDGQLTITPESDFEGDVVLELSAIDACGNTAITFLDVSASAPPTGPLADCTTTFTYTAQGTPSVVAIAGSFNDWDPEADPMTDQGNGTWTIDLDLAPGPYTYKFVEIQQQAFEDLEQWVCDPSAELISCDPGYKEPWATDWAHDCTLGNNTCNSLIVVPECTRPTLSVDTVDVNVGAGTLRVEVSATAGGAPLAEGTALLDDEPVAGAFDGERFVVDTTVTPGRHTLRFTVTDTEGFVSDEAYVPVWSDGADDDAAVIYFAFVDRLANGDPSLDVSEGATASGGGYEGGDVQGLIDLLPYLDDMGVTMLWLSNLQGNTEGAWDGDCGQTYAGYHAYWPDAAREPEEHFGNEALIEQLVDEAHARGMRVIMDWVANHVHETHPYAIEHPEWFNDDGVCKDSVDGQQNWDRIPESCAFAPYIPDLDYSQPEVMTTMIDDALWWATTYELDGFRVDAVKHMPHAVTYNLQSLVKSRLEHEGSGLDTDFYTVGETFDSYDRIKAYIGDDQLDAQFDFDLYYSIRNAFLRPETGELGGLWQSWETSKAVYGDAPMSTFLGNHDVLRFISDGAEGWVDPCQDGQIAHAPAPTEPWPYESLRLGWTFLFTMPGRPLVYYGDELGMPGRNDPDNRQPLWWHAGDHAGVDSVEAMASKLQSEQAATLRHVAALGRARADHPALYSGSWQEWWNEYDVYAVARHSGSDHALVLLNRSFDGRQLDNGLSFAGLPEGTYTDVLTGQTYGSSGDVLSVDVPARGSRVLVYTP
jgi:glycosidase